MNALPTAKLRPFWLWLALFATTLAAYGPALRGGFIWDDDRHVTRSDLRSLHGLGRIWTEVGATQQYYPVLHGAFWLEHRLWGDAPWGYHLLNVLLHATSACLLVVILSRLWADETLTRSAPRSAGAERASVSWPAVLAGLLFALHPVCVESVAWISEQKNTLSTVFYLLAALTYLKWREPGVRPGSGGPGLYVLATLFFVLALLSKTVTATLPAALLVIAWWKRGRVGWRDVAPLLPWLVLGISAGLFTAWVERRFIGAEGEAFDLGFVARCLLAGRVIWFYLGKLLWPAHLIFIYPRWQISPADAAQYLYPAGVVALLAALAWKARRSRGPLAAFLFFAGSLVPALGFVNVYPFVYSYVADHFQYLASLGIVALAAGAWGVGLRRQDKPAAFYALAAAAVLLLGALSWRQCRSYRSAEVLYRDTLAKNPGCWMAEVNLGKILHESGRTSEAIPHFQAGARLRPQAKTFYDLGNALQDAGRLREAEVQYIEALRREPAYPDAEANLGLVLASEGRPAEAEKHYRLALGMRPDLAEAHNNLGNVYFQEKRLPEASVEFEAALRLRPNYPKARNGLGGVYFRDGKMAEAARQFEEAIRLDPAYAEAHLNLGVALSRMGRVPEAMEECRRALLLRPNLGSARNFLRQLQAWQRTHSE